MLCSFLSTLCLFSALNIYLWRDSVVSLPVSYSLPFSVMVSRTLSYFILLNDNAPDICFTRSVLLISTFTNVAAVAGVVL